MLNQCPNCSGSLRYDIASGSLKCIHCDSFFDVDTYDSNTAAEEYETRIFTCPACGAEITSSDLSAVDYCMYCGSFVSLESHMQKVKKPELILPFSKTAEDCKNIYRRGLRRRIYAPKEFRDEKFLEGFKGIYIPYWVYDYSFGPTLELSGHTTSRQGDYILTQHYDITCEAQGTVNGIIYDASSTFDDEISSKIAPFPRESMLPFKGAYLFGFFADTADAKSEVYEVAALQTASYEIWRDIKWRAEIQDGYPDTPKLKDVRKNFNMKSSETLAMLPVWFLTWRKDDKVAYSVVNGNSGELYAEIPVSIFRYLLISLLTAIPIFLLLNNTITFSATNLLVIAVVMSILMILLYSFQLERIVRRTMHSDDAGYLSTHEDDRKANEEREKSNLSYFIMQLDEKYGKFLNSGLVLFVFFLCVLFHEFLGYGLIFLAALVPVCAFFWLRKNVKLLKNPGIYLDLAGAVGAIIVSAIILFLDPAPDKFYYFAAILCMLATAFTAIRMMRRYNDLILRPVPHFFDRKEGE